MAISVITQPKILAPVNKELWYQISDSVSYTKTNYKYIYKVNYKAEPFSTAFKATGTYKVPPNPSGQAVFSPHKILKSYFKPFVNPFVGAVGSSMAYLGIDNALIRYNITYGAEYNPNISFTTTSNNAGKLQINFTTPANALVVGDIITIEKANKQVNISYDGTASITQVVSSLSYKTDKTYGISSTNENGAITNVLRYQAGSVDRDCYNGTRQYTERATDFDLVYTLVNASRKFMTNYTGSKKIQVNDYETLSAMLSSTATGTNLIYITWKVGNTTNTLFIPFTGNAYRRVDLGVGPANLLGLSFTSYPVLSSIVNCTSYTVQIFRLTGSGVYTPQSEQKTYVIDSTCSPYIKKRVCFLNRVGGYDYFNFTMDSKRTVSIKRDEYSKTLDWNYNIGDRGATVFAMDVDEVFYMNTNWITEKECAWLEELLTSPDVYLIEGTNKIPIVILDSKYESKTAMRDRIFNLTVNYKLANKMNIQND